MNPRLREANSSTLVFGYGCWVKQVWSNAQQGVLWIEVVLWPKADVLTIRGNTNVPVPIGTGRNPCELVIW